ncbi:c-type cytochrome [Helicobacter mustelae]|uniref:Putative cytochrome C-related protein n=1 Tax=Helicobacter mustelae (strain ATCC 43772 / CCUG 25715 / CIP 103759 / LMG 18044 / NCTC 12198 / R85-136P) TaxID=679897 RepID=D3UJ15_HELM1|nr:c-type cytochrome [Helicobacter mustelae]CBG40490.1 putative cytochrome C precursor-related protein [Helicobacter mustelae 12198]SQH71989.1 cytochrome C precursor-related protein [Helicobacter mustelae]STP13132.1 cytochrome C precursor-related protein [Helicobacter mustelae]
MKRIALFALASSLSLLLAEAPAIYKKCQICHGATGQKMAPGAKHTIAGQPKEKLLADLKGYKAGTADNGGNKAIMYRQMKNVSDADIEALAEYISKLPAK